MNGRSQRNFRAVDFAAYQGKDHDPPQTHSEEQEAAKPSPTTRTAAKKPGVKR
jgi:hypothetical protein